MKILITCPNLDFLGGVTNQYRGLKPYWTEDVKYQQIGKRNQQSKRGKYWLIYDAIIFIINILSIRPDCVLLNPSISKSALKRDFLLQRIAKILGVRTALFIHGFDIPTFDGLDKVWLKANFNRSSLIFVLAKSFKRRLEAIGITTPIVQSTTKVDDRLIEHFDISKKDGSSRDLLFLSRVEKAKGIYESLEVFRILKRDYPSLRFRIVGDGSELNNVINFVESERLEDVIITGALEGSEIANAFQESLLLLLSSYGEGLPTSVLEAMAFGLPIITRPVGGLIDFFEDGKMGYINETLDPKVIADNVRPYLDNQDLVIRTAKYNHNYATKHFLASKVAKDIENQLSKHF